MLSLKSQKITLQHLCNNTLDTKTNSMFKKKTYDLQCNKIQFKVKQCYQLIMFLN